MKVMAIMGSPRGKGNGYMVVKEIEWHMEGMGEVEFEYIFLKDANLEMCQGCFSCVSFGEDKCPLKDDRTVIEEKILATDGLILSSPMHVFNVSSLMKNFIDRFAYTQGRPKFFGQKMLLVLNSNGGIRSKNALAALRIALGGINIVHELNVATPLWLEQEKMVRRKEKTIAEGAEKLFKACMHKQLPDPGIKNYLEFRLFKRGFTDFKEVVPACYEFYRGKDYYYKAKISSVAKLAAWAIVPLAMLLTKDYLPGNVKWPR